MASTKSHKSSEPPLASRVVQVTPEMAAKWLETTGPNRPVHQATVERLAADMSNAAWYLNGDRIRFDENDALRDGRHRLSAVVLSGQTVPMEILQGLS